MTRRTRLSTYFALAIFAAGTLPLSACQNSGTSTVTKPAIDIKERPNPQKAHRIEMIIENAPGPFGVIEGSAQYDVINHFECGYIDPVPGIASRINTHPPLVWTPIGDGRYETTVYEDLMVDEDYYGRGVCRWKLTAVSAMLKATDADSNTPFLPGISAEEIGQGDSVVTYFPNKSYPADKGYEGLSDLGSREIEKYRPELRGSLFSVTFVVKEAGQ
jgi:hypothetical protein